MAQWDQSTARTSLRTLLADSAADKFEFKIPTYPGPDGVTKQFSVGRTRIDEASLHVYVRSVELESDQIAAVDAAAGLVTLVNAPDAGVSVLATFTYQWFTDSQLDDFLLGAIQLLGFETCDAVTPINLRPPALDFAAYYAYLYLAALNAEELVVSAGGYEAHQSRTHPNWRELARLSYERGQQKLKLYLEAGLAARTPALEFTSYSLPNYQGR